MIVLNKTARIGLIIALYLINLFIFLFMVPVGSMQFETTLFDKSIATRNISITIGTVLTGERVSGVGADGGYYLDELEQLGSFRSTYDEWKKSIKSFIQLLLISSLFLFIWLERAFNRFERSFFSPKSLIFMVIGPIVLIVLFILLTSVANYGWEETNKIISMSFSPFYLNMRSFFFAFAIVGIVIEAGRFGWNYQQAKQVR